MRREKKIIGAKIKRKKIKMKCINLILHNDRETLVNMDNFLYATRITTDTLGDITKITWSTGQELDVLDKIHEIQEKLSNLN
jgi:hypothetical protein